MRRRVRCFYEDFIKTEPYTVMDAGLRVIELKRVVGTVDKCGELDDRFRYILPACSVIRDSHLPSFYPELNERDIFVLIAGFYNDFMGGIPAEDFQAIISGFMFAYSIPEHRRWRNSPFRLLGKMINRRGKVPVFPPER
jgi:hypothetical protein